MQSDEQQIRQLVATWMAASKAGNVDEVLRLMAEDAVFLVAGQLPMRKSDFAAAARSQYGQAAPKIDGASEIQEIKVLGDWAFMWTKLTVVAMPPDGSPSITRAGHTFPFSRKSRVSGYWLATRTCYRQYRVRRNDTPGSRRTLRLCKKALSERCSTQVIDFIRTKDWIPMKFGLFAQSCYRSRLGYA